MFTKSRGYLSTRKTLQGHQMLTEHTGVTFFKCMHHNKLMILFAFAIRIFTDFEDLYSTCMCVREPQLLHEAWAERLPWKQALLIRWDSCQWPMLNWCTAKTARKDGGNILICLLNGFRKWQMNYFNFWHAFELITFHPVKLLPYILAY